MRPLEAIIILAYVGRVGRCVGLPLAAVSASGANLRLVLASSIFYQLHDRVGVVRDPQFAARNRRIHDT